jgi:hypothetical protein
MPRQPLRAALLPPIPLLNPKGRLPGWMPIVRAAANKA